MSKAIKLTFDIDLTDYDVTEFKKNPLVMYNFDYNGLPVGKAKISKDKKHVTVTLAPEELNPLVKLIDASTFSVAQAYTEDKDHYKELVSLSAVLERKPK